MDDGERVEIRCTVVDAGRLGARAEVAVGGPHGTTFAAVSGLLADALGLDESAFEAAPFRCEGRVVPASARLGEAPLLDGALLVSGGAATGPAAVPGLLAAHVVAGPGAGAVVTLPPGEHEVGRAGSGLRLTDPDVSRTHAQLTVSPTGVTVADAGSRHGTWVDGERAGREPVSAQVGASLRFGASTVVLRPPASRPAALVPDRAGHLLLNRRPHLATPRPEMVVPVPEEPPSRPRARLPVLTMLLPLAVSVAVALIARQPLFLLFALTTPALMAGQYLADRRAGGRERRERAAAYAAELATARAAIAEALRADAAHLERELPDLAALLETATSRTTDLWHRSGADAAALRVRLGRGRAESVVRERRGGRARQHEDVPIGLALSEVRVLGVAGSRATAAALARSLLGQLAVLHSPLDVGLTARQAHAGQDWAWLRWLPHAGAETPARQVVLLDGAEVLRREPQVAGWLAAGETGPVLICLADDVSRLPLECAATVVVGTTALPGAGVTARLHRAGREPVDVTLDLPEPAWTERISRALAPVRDASPRASALHCPPLPTLLRGADGVDIGDAVDLARHWRRPVGPGRGPTATLGVRPGALREPFRVDLVRDGPHLLVGGTTGSGKSHLLASLVIGWAADRGPDEVSFLLVDYKGGAAFRACAGLPHVTGVVTDLDHHLAERAITSLGAELRRRERLLAATGCPDVTAYQRLRLSDGRLPALPRLVVVVDEFRVLAEELPDFVGGLVRVAGLGRSLGVHLALATQRPAGAVSPEIRANTSLRIALRVQEAGDSHDILGVADAASIPASAPGRALARTGEGELVALQVAALGGTSAATGVTLERLDDRLQVIARLGREEPDEPVDGGNPVVDAMQGAAARLGLTPAAPPWQPPLPDRLSWRPGPDGVAFGLADQPEEQAQRVACWHPTRGNLAVVGGPGSGRTTALLTVARALAHEHVASAVHLYGVDGGAGATGLAELEALPHCGAVVPADDGPRATRLLARLRETVARRRVGPIDPTRATVVLLVDGWESVSSVWAGVEHGRLTDELVALMREGSAHGVHVLVAGGRSVLTGQLSTTVTDRVVLRFADPMDAALAGVPVVRGAQPTGRGFHVGPGSAQPVEVQVALPPVVEPGPPVDGGPFRLRPLPASVAYDEVDHEPDQGVGAGLAVPVGVGGDEATTLFLRLDGPGVTLVHGPPGSGRTNVLAVIEAGLRQQGVPVVRVDPRTTTVPFDAVLLVDDAAKLGGTPAEEIVTARLAKPEPRVVLVTATGDLVTAFRGPLAEGRAARRGVALGNLPPADAGLLGLAPRAGDGRPGRGVVVHPGEVVTVQLAHPPGDHR
ncbi:FtsK/SpoIIIE domain-containing protein [Spongisporangium articulatum]|uniref:FtsK/SpoIIIE domain-containing protein n=1 Tax=Spongisporangium articulatum TaxID=3362603 RepID=A0ABW8AK08_9ACTN